MCNEQHMIAQEIKGETNKTQRDGAQCCAARLMPASRNVPLLAAHNSFHVHFHQIRFAQRSVIPQKVSTCSLGQSSVFIRDHVESSFRLNLSGKSAVSETSVQASVWTQSGWRGTSGWFFVDLDAQRGKRKRVHGQGPAQGQNRNISTVKPGPRLTFSWMH